VHIFIGLAAAVLIVWIAWRLISRIGSFPCPTWLSWILDTPHGKGISGRTAKTLERLHLEPGMNVVDVGCGPGRVTVPIAKMIGPEGEVTALDLQAGMLEKARVSAKAANAENIRFVQAGAGDGKLEQNYYDRALLVTVLGEIPNREAALKEIFTALKPGGLLSVEEVILDPHFQRQTTVRKLAATAGFREKECFGNALAFTMNLEKL